MFGGVAQLGEHLPCKQGVRSSILLISTNIMRIAFAIRYFFKDGVVMNTLQNLINSVADNSTFVFPEKEYYFEERIVIKDKSNVTIDGDGAVITTKYVNSDDYRLSSDGFLIEDCKNVTLKNFVIKPDTPTNLSLTVEEIDLEANTLVVKADDYYNIHGNEVLIGFCSVDEDGSADFHLDSYGWHPNHKNLVNVIQGEVVVFGTYVGHKVDYLGDRRFRVYYAENIDLSRIKVGDRLYVRHTMYGPSVITVRNSDDTHLEDITMYSTPGMGVMVLPRCHNFYVDNVNMLKPEGDPTYLGCNCDGFHVTGLTGELIMKNCIFDGMADDALNVHSSAGTITGIDMESSTLRCNYQKRMPDGKLGDRWCAKGDLIKVYHPETLVETATFNVVSFKDETLVFENLQGKFDLNYIIQNTSLSPSVLVEGCTVNNSRARGILTQTENVEVRNCNFFGISNAAVMTSPAFWQWYEVGPANNFYIHHNKIVKCGFVNNRAGIIVGTNHDGIKQDFKKMHKNVRIENNIFENCNEGYIDITATDGVKISGNTFVPHHGIEKGKVITDNCTNTEID